jgi:hypothetical protein
MSRFFDNKLIYILSPQPWGHLHISKHHYARELSKNNTVFFISPPTSETGVKFTVESISDKLNVLRYSVPAPKWLKFKFPLFYKFIVKQTLKRLLKRNFSKGDICIDFGCYQQLQSVKFFPAVYKIFFPVDDFSDLKPWTRGCDIVFTVSENIQMKYKAGNCHLINHGLSDNFSEIALRELNNNTWAPSEKTNVAYAGNIFLQFVDTKTFKSLISNNREVSFHFFGSHHYDPHSEWQRDWHTFLTTSANVTLHGHLDTKQLAEAYRSIDIFILCYKPDYVNYHGENSHKVLEYLSTGKTLVTTFLSIYQGCELMAMSEKDKNEELLKVFSDVVSNLDQQNSERLMKARKVFALENTYEKQLNRIGRIVETLGRK